MRAALLAVAMTGCIDGPGRQGWALDDLDADYSYFVNVAQPVLAADCSNPSCHGAAERPLELYAVHQHRVDPDDVFLDTPLTDVELWRNFVRSRAFALDARDPADASLVRKPLDPAEGGTKHVGGIQYGDTDNPGYQALLTWITEEEEP